jgi:hypothetical protein
MASGRPSLPLAFRVVNRAGGRLRALGLPVGRLDASAILAAARRRTGLEDLGDGPVHEGYPRLVESLEREADLTPMGRLIARRELDRVLENRLRLVDAWRRHPEIEAEPVRAPIVIVGLPRTGTSILHELLAQDPASRVPRTWEVMWPWPPPEAAHRDDDPRIARAARHFRGIDRALPDMKKMHAMGARLPQECVVLMAHDCATIMHHTTHDVPSYQRWLEGLDFRPVYASHKRQLQYLQWRDPGERWVLKSPGHLWALAALLAVYPDARIVQTHRDPLRVAASLVSLVTYLRGLASASPDPRRVAADWAPRLAAGLEHTIDVRDRGLLPPARVFDVPFSDLVGNELATIERLYAHFGLTLGGAAADAMRAYLARNPKGKHGAHRYDLAAAGLDVAEERRRFRRYRERFDLVDEDVVGQRG